MCVCWLAFGAPVTLLGARAAHAQATPAKGAEPSVHAFRVVFSSSSVCENPNEFVEQLQRRTKQLRPADAVEPALTFYVSLTSTQAGVQGTLRVQNVDGTDTERQVPGVDCHEVLSAMALIGALTVDPFALTGENLPPPPPPPTATAVPLPPPAAAPKPESFHFGVGGRVNVNGGVLPGLGLGGSAFAEASMPVAGVFHPGVRLAGHFARASKDANSAPPLNTGAFRWLSARVSLCPLLWSPHPAFGVRPCVLADVGQLRARGTNTVNDRKYDLFWAATGLELELELKLVGPLSLGAEAGFMLPLVPRDHFDFVPTSETSQVHEISSGFAGGLGLGLRFF
ncbi:MAG TPA: hypothetical protein VG937_10860 [Polyangiaceae bacterium]|nr:hypothetical protein [Polyangiaceae bacterium]